MGTLGSWKDDLVDLVATYFCQSRMRALPVDAGINIALEICHLPALLYIIVVKAPVC